MRVVPFLVFALFVAGCSRGPTAATSSPEKPKVEADLAFTHLSNKAYEKLDIKTQPAVVKEVQERLTLTGWIMAKPGNEVTLTAPAAGYVRLAKNGLPVPGDRVEPKVELLHIKPVLSPAEQIQVNALKRSIQSELKKAETTLTQAESDRTRIKPLFDKGIRSEQEYELAVKARDHALEEVAAAKDKLKLFDLPEESIVAPRQGTVLQTHVSAGQYVSASAPLVTLIDLSSIWIRVPVPEYDLPAIDRTKKITVAWKNSEHERKDQPAFFSASPTGRVAQVDPLKHTADLWYELEPTKDADKFVKDQMVTVRLPIGKKEKATVLPYAAIIFDAHGHGWIYVERAAKDGKHQFERRPVELLGAEDDKVIVRSSLSGGEAIVTQGASILFSRDFHKTPLKIDGEDGD